jgi:TolB protein
MRLVRLTQSFYPKHHLTVTPNSKRIVFARFKGVHMTLMTVASGGSEERVLIENSPDYVQQHPVFSPDGKHLIYCGNVGYRTGGIGLYLCDVDDLKCSHVRPLPTSGQGQMSSWSPDGKQIVYVAYRVNAAHLFVANADGSKPRQLTNLAGFAVQPSWSPDGQWIAFSGTHEGNYKIYKIHPDGSDLTRLTNELTMDYRPQWSPDGKWLAFTSNRDGNYEIYLMRPDGTELRNLTQHPALDDHAAWFPDGSGLAFVSTRDGGFDVYRMSVI